MKKYILINYTSTHVGHCVIVGERTTHKPFENLHLIKVIQNKGKWSTGDIINIDEKAWSHIITFDSDNLEEVMEQALLEVL